MAQIKPNASIIFATVNGAVGTVLAISEEIFLKLLKLQMSMGKNAKSIGGFSYQEYVVFTCIQATDCGFRWRAFKTDYTKKDYYSFIDGDLIESFLDLPQVEQERLLNMDEQPEDRATVIRIIEDLRMLH